MNDWCKENLLYHIENVEERLFDIKNNKIKITFTDTEMARMANLIIKLILELDYMFKNCTNMENEYKMDESK